MVDIHTVDTREAAAALAELLNGDTRTRPIVVVTTPAGRTEPWIDPQAIADETGALADIYVLPTGPVTWGFSENMAEGTQVYGGAGRVYPVGHDWASDLSISPLRFAFGATDGKRATESLTSDALKMAAAAGLTESAANPGARPVEGIVQGTTAGRAIVKIGSTIASIAEELTVEGVPIDRLVHKDQPIAGLLDPTTGRLDVSAHLRSSDDALSVYRPGTIVLTQVATVDADTAELVLYPKTSTPAAAVRVPREDITTNPHDDLRTLMSLGEVIAARVVSTSPDWRLVLLDVDDDEPVLEAPSLLPGGPPWLEDKPATTVPFEPDEPPLPLPAAAPPMAPMPTPPAAAAAVDSSTKAAVRPSPAIFGRKVSRPGPGDEAKPPTTAGTAGTQELLRTIDTLKAEVRAITTIRDELLEERQGAAQEREQLRALLDHTERRANAAEHTARGLRSQLRKASSKKATPAATDGPQFADPEQGFRHLVTTRWATRIHPSEQAERELPDYAIGADFLDSLASLEGISTEKVADVVVEILLGMAPSMPGREVHQLRTGTGGDDPPIVRSDKAVAWRASLQVKTPSARRIHYWTLPTGRVELARVATHDDFGI
ncbi:hypothetical protein ACSDQ9_09210 [Aestuariimicrobium soli]|uniref:hypothetical protein n=1 Tax=Aestuariimicrobium soli TaxID=2035834 RepID=UPI003EBE95A2